MYLHIFTIILCSVAQSLVNAEPVGSAVFVNHCNRSIALDSIPAQDGGYSRINTTLKPGEVYSQQYTTLRNGGSWSIELSDHKYGARYLWLDYLFTNNGTLSFNFWKGINTPWNGSISLSSSTHDCRPYIVESGRKSRPLFQVCPQTVILTLTLCTGRPAIEGTTADELSSTNTASFTNVVSDSTKAYPSLMSLSYNPSPSVSYIRDNTSSETEYETHTVSRDACLPPTTETVIHTITATPIEAVFKAQIINEVDVDYSED